jgi:hypothetical protein
MEGDARRIRGRTMANGSSKKKLARSSMDEGIKKLVTLSEGAFEPCNLQFGY